MEIPTFFKYFYQPQHKSIHKSFLIGWTSCRISQFPSHWLSGRLLYEIVIVRKLEVLTFSFLMILQNC